MGKLLESQTCSMGSFQRRTSLVRPYDRTSFYNVRYKRLKRIISNKKNSKINK
ncbi:MAG: hypothetical protein ABH811_00795 [archaeon]